MLVIPSLDLRNGQVVRLQQGDYTRQLNYALDPIILARQFEAAGAKLMHVVDLDGAKAGRPAQIDRIRAIAQAVSIPVQVGGGVRSTGDVEALIDAGAARIVIGTYAMENWTWFSEMAHDNGSRAKLFWRLTHATV